MYITASEKNQKAMCLTNHCFFTFNETRALENYKIEN